MLDFVSNNSLIMQSIKPLKDRVIAQKLTAETKTPAGLVIPENSTDKSDRARVVAVGPGRLSQTGARIQMDVKEGDTIVFNKYAGQTIKIEGQELLVLKEEDIIAITN